MSLLHLPRQKIPSRKTSAPIPQEEYPPHMDKEIQRLKGEIQKNKSKIRQYKALIQQNNKIFDEDEQKLDDEMNDAQNSLARETNELDNRRKVLRQTIKKAKKWTPDDLQFHREIDLYTNQLDELQNQQEVFIKELDDLAIVVKAMKDSQSFASEKLGNTRIPKFASNSSAAQLQQDLFNLRNQIIRKYSQEFGNCCVI